MTYVACERKAGKKIR